MGVEARTDVQSVNHFDLPLWPAANTSITSITSSVFNPQSKIRRRQATHKTKRTDLGSKSGRRSDLTTGSPEVDDLDLGGVHLGRHGGQVLLFFFFGEEGAV